MSLLEWEVLNSIDSQVLSIIYYNLKLQFNSLYSANPRYQGLLVNVQKRCSVSISDTQELVFDLFLTDFD